MNREPDQNKPFQVGGQAVIEGVMMRAPGCVATAVRRSDGTILVKRSPFQSIAERMRVFKLPILRGAVGLVEMLHIGIKTLNFSAEIAMQGEESEGKKQSEKPVQNKKSTKENILLWLTVALSLILGIAIFFVTPLAITTFFFEVDQDPVYFNLVAGAIRVVLLVAYISGISLMKDIFRLFQYHGAEHKAVFAFERGLALTVTSASLQTRFHPRCGTSFLLIVMFVSIIFFSLLDAALIRWLGSIDIVIRIVTHIPLIPFVGGVAYEVIRFSAKHAETRIGKAVVAPGLWLQKITTKEPDPDQIEVAVVALLSALGRQGEIAVSYEMFIEQEEMLAA